MTKEQYEALSRPFRGRPLAVKGLKVANRCLTLSCYLLYPSLLLWALVTGDPACSGWYWFRRSPSGW